MATPELGPGKSTVPRSPMRQSVVHLLNAVALEGEEFEYAGLSEAQAELKRSRKAAATLARDRGYEIPEEELGDIGLDVLITKSVKDLLLSTDIQLCVEEGSNIPVRLQGNVFLYTKRAIKKRKKIKNSVKMRKELIQWWHLLNFENKGGVDLSEFTKLFCALANLLHVEYSVEDAERDFLDDARGKEALNFAAFSRSLFELIDMWVDSAEVHDYLEFMEEAIQHVRHPPIATVVSVVTFLTVAWLKTFLSDAARAFLSPLMR
ncbi:hypothetical protein CYMTET_50147 [Cymbomonas tetramitiformis]|uniref:EF-hand domain-containing protein n=1 Tax=Cymbomonas tetramitiformis TaxID=36881 RepID=A0AAE0ET46_9CHLO|nr:hypothetical protein CYMTET_50147 [Cymbomonas tetramitiformis]